MGLMPDALGGRIGFFETRVPEWEAHAAALGLSDDAVAALAAAVKDAREAQIAQAEAENAARAATLRYHQAVGRMQHAPGLGSDMIRTIRTQAQNTANPDLYILARIPAPPAPGRPNSAPAPGIPTTLRATLLPDGTLDLRWKCPNPRGTQGTIYEILRVEPESGRGVFLGTCGVKRFIDPAPRGPLITYQITAVRGVKRGRSAVFNVRLGVGGEGGVGVGVGGRLVA